MSESPPSYEDIFDARGHLYNEAVSRCPGAREAERAALLDRLDARPGQVIGDAPAGGGYVADGIRIRHRDSVEIVCIEPARRFGAAINPVFRVLHDSLDKTRLESGALDGVASLAGLHHFEVKDPVYVEWARLIRSGGRLAVADVEEGTRTGEFLNTFVDAHTPGGHKGVFLHEGEFSERLTAAGFASVQEERLAVPWLFSDKGAMAEFCSGLFGIQSAGLDEVESALRGIVGVDESEDGSCRLRWELRYATALR